MRFLQYMAFAIFLVATFELSLTEFSKRKKFKTTLPMKPESKTYNTHIREFNECVSCNTNDSARKDFVNCLKGLSEENKKLVKSCCTNVFDASFCQKASDGEIDFGFICKDPMKGIQVERCFWKRTNQNTANIAELRKCKLNILDLYCTDKSEDIIRR